MSGSNLAY